MSAAESYLRYRYEQDQGIQLLVRQEKWVLYKIVNPENQKYRLDVYHIHDENMFDTYHCGTICSKCEQKVPENIIATKAIHDLPI